MLNWTHLREESIIQSQIAKRAYLLGIDLGYTLSVIDLVMDIDACHSNGCPLKLYDLLNADKENFAHDVFGIRANINRQTGQLENCFVPRYAQNQ